MVNIKPKKKKQVGISFDRHLLKQIDRLAMRWETDRSTTVNRLLRFTVPKALEKDW